MSNIQEKKCNKVIPNHKILEIFVYHVVTRNNPIDQSFYAS